MSKLRVVLMLAALLAFAGLAHGQETKDAQPAAGEVVLRLGMDADPESMDPHMILSGATLQYSHTVFDPLVRWTKEGVIEPRLAERWEQPNPTTTRFYLRKGVKFHSGNDFTAKDVVWTMDRLKKSQEFKGLFAPFTAAEAVDDYTVDLKTKEPYSLVLAMATYLFPLDAKFYTGADESGQPKDLINKTGPSFANFNESGTGAFRVVKREKGVKWELERFKDYWDKNSPGNVAKIVLTPIKEEATRVAALLSGDVDMIQPVPPQDYKRVGDDPKLQLITMPGTRVITFQMNQERRPEFKDKRVRQALILAVNNDGIVQAIMKGAATAAHQQSPKGLAGFNPELKTRYNIEKSKALMKEAGFENGFEATMIATNNRYVNDEKIAEAVASMLAKINIKVSLKTYPKAQYWDEHFHKHEADLQMIGWHPDTEDSANYSEYLLMCRSKDTGMGQYNSGDYCNPELDKLVLASRSELDQAKRAKLLQDVERLAYDDAAFIPLHWQNLSWAAKKNFKIEPIVNGMDYPHYGDLKVEK